jgi:hypothetical protein
MAWTLRLRGARNGATSLELPERGGTTLAQLRFAVAAAVDEEVQRLIIKTGFPPKVLCEDGGDEALITGVEGCSRSSRPVCTDTAICIAASGRLT